MLRSAATFVLSTCLLAGWDPGPAGAVEPVPRDRTFSGSSLEEAIERVRELGLSVIYSSALVRPEMRVTGEPSVREPRRLLDQLLAPHGLRAIPGESGALVVVLAAPSRRGQPTAGGAVRGEIRSIFDQRPVVGALVRLLPATVDSKDLPTGELTPSISAANGRFEITGLEPGRYRLRVYHPGFTPLATTEVEVPPDGASDLRLELQPEPYLHEEILVAASRSSVLHAEPAGPLSLSRDDVESLPHLANDLFRALTLLPGTAANDNTAQFSLRGGRRDELLIALDGQELYQAFHLPDFDNGLSVVAADTLEGVTLSTGAYDAEHGDRMGGVLDLTTRSPRSTTSRLRLSVLNAQLSSGGTLGERVSWLGAARRGSLDLAGRVFGREDPSFWDAYGKLEVELGDRHQLRVHTLRAADALGFTETIEGETKRYDTDYDGTYAWLSHDVFLGARTLGQTTLSRSAFDRDRRGDENEEEQAWAVIDERDTEVVALDTRWTFEASPRTATRWGAAFRRFETDYDYTSSAEAPLLPPSQDFEPRTELRRFSGSARDEHTEAWLSQRFSPVPSLTFELGARYDRHTLTDDELWSPRFSLAWRAGESRVLRASWGHYHQSQRSYELGVADGESTFARAERAEHAVLGWEQRFSEDPNASLQALKLELYGRWIDDPRDRFENLYEPINVFQEIEPDRVLVRSEQARARGLELTLRGALGERSTWWLSYALSRAEDHIAGEWIPRPLDQSHAITLFFGRRLGENWQLDAAWRFHTGWPTTPIQVASGSPRSRFARWDGASLGEDEDTEDEDPADEGGEPGEEEGEDPPEETGPIFQVGRLGSDRLSAYHRLDLRLSRTWTFPRKKLRFFVDVQNAYDRKNIAGFDLIVDDETGELEKAAERWNGVFPSIGIVLEF